MFLRMAVGNWTVMLCLEPLVVGSVPAVSWRRKLLHRAGLVEVVGEILAARGEGPGGGVDDVEPGVRHRGHAGIFAHLEHGRPWHAVERDVEASIAAYHARLRHSDM